MRRLALTLVVLAGVAPPPALAGNPDHVRVSQAETEVRPLGAVLKAIERRYPGRALDAQLTEGGDRPTYRIKWLGADGRVREVIADARTGEILRVR